MTVYRCRMLDKEDTERAVTCENAKVAADYFVHQFVQTKPGDVCYIEVERHVERKGQPLYGIWDCWQVLCLAAEQAFITSKR